MKKVAKPSRKITKKATKSATTNSGSSTKLRAAVKAPVAKAKQAAAAVAPIAEATQVAAAVAPAVEATQAVAPVAPLTGATQAAAAVVPVAEATTAATVTESVASEDASTTASDTFRVFSLHPKLFDRPNAAELLRTFEAAKARADITIDYLPDGRIVTGAHIFEAMAAHGELPVTYRLRDDLIRRDRFGEQHAEVLRDNLSRSDLPRDQKAYAVTQLYLIEMRGPFRVDDPTVKRELTEKFTELGFSDPEAEALLQLAKAPEVVQRAVARGVLDLDQGVAIAALDADTQAEVDNAITSKVDYFCGRRLKCDPAQVKQQIEDALEEVIQIVETPDGTVPDPFGSFIDSLRTAVSELEGEETVDTVRLAHELPTLTAAYTLLGNLIVRGAKSH